MRPSCNSDQLELALATLAFFNGNASRASRHLAEKGLTIPERTLRRWKNSDAYRETEHRWNADRIYRNSDHFKELIANDFRKALDAIAEAKAARTREAKAKALQRLGQIAGLPRDLRRQPTRIADFIDLDALEATLEQREWAEGFYTR